MQIRTTHSFVQVVDFRWKKINFAKFQMLKHCYYCKWTKHYRLLVR